MSYEILHGDCRVMLAAYPDNHFDSAVIDAPYGLSKEPDMAEVLRHWLAGDDYKAPGGGFMGKSWDSFVPGPATWREVLRTLKPGACAAIFAGSRTQDLMGVSLRLAGFEIRDTLMWVYGSGFPKSLDISKAVDAADRIGASRQRALQFTEWMRSTGITAAQINEATGSCMGSHYLTDKEQPAVATLEMYVFMAHLLPTPPPEILQLMEWRTVESENLKRREVVGRSDNGIAGGTGQHGGVRGAYGFGAEFDITAAHTDEAKQWEGWGTALKPAYEPIILARKPLIGTVADNVLTWGVGGLNIDGCRVPAEYATGWGGSAGLGYHGGTDPDGGAPRPVTGRWPANILHDGSDEVVALFPDARGQRGAVSDAQRSQGAVYGAPSDTGKDYAPRSDTATSAARFFYCAKASKADRNEGLDHLRPVSAGEMTGCRAEGSDGLNSPRAGAGRTGGAANHHPTVKPTDLMCWLVRLVTPPGGHVLDAMAGSGSTGKAALLEGFRVTLIESEADYIPIIEGRCVAALVEYLTSCNK